MIRHVLFIFSMGYPVIKVCKDGQQLLLADLVAVPETSAIVEELTIKLYDVGAVVSVIFVQILYSKLKTIVDHS